MVTRVSQEMITGLDEALSEKQDDLGLTDVVSEWDDGEAETTDKAMSPAAVVGAIAAAGGMKLLSSQTLDSNQANVDVALPDGYERFRLELQFRPATDDTVLYMRTSADGASFSSGGSDYSYAIVEAVVDGVGADGPFVDGDVSNDGIALTTEIDNTAGLSATVVVDLLDVGGSLQKRVLFRSAFDGGDKFRVVDGSGVRRSTSAIKAVRFYFSSGNVAAGSKYTLYGMA